MTNYIALSATLNNETIVMIFSNEAASLDAMKDMVALGNRCVRFITDEAAYFAYSHGKNLSVEFVAGDDGRNLKRIAVEVH